MELSEHFSIAELTTTSTGLYNTPGQTELEKLLYLTTYLLEPIRERFGKITITSGFRSRFVNEAIGGSKTSQHSLGEAVDFIPEEPLEAVFDWCKSNLKYGQCILESQKGKRWIHISLPRLARPNQMAMTFNDGIYENVA